MGNWD
jgi:hypothetical protein